MSGSSPWKNARAIAVRMIETIAPAAVKSWGIDKDAWCAALIARMRSDEPTADAVIRAESGDAVYRTMVDDYIRSTRNAAVENLTDLEDIKAQLRSESQIVQLRSPDGSYVAKPLKDCTADELDALAAQYERSAAADTRRARFCRQLAVQMRLAGLADTDPLSKLIA